MSAASVKPIDRKLSCPLCPLSFANNGLRKRHKKARHPTCDECHKIFLDNAARKGHRAASGHCFCRECNRHFESVAKYVDHVRSVRHSTQYECCDCGQEYPTQAHLGRHCCDCDRIFPSRRGLEKHSATSTDHKGPRVSVPRIEPATEPARKSKKSRKKRERNIPCSAGGGKCIKRFATPSALLNHLESGRCPSGMTRETIKNLVLTHDRNGYIANPGATERLTALLPSGTLATIADSPDVPPNLMDYSSPPDKVKSPLSLNDDNISEWSVIGGVQLTPTSSCADDDWSDVNGVALTPADSNWSLVSGTHTPAELSSSHSDPTPQPLATPGRNLRCPLCPRMVHNLRGLEMHMSSPAHAPKIFHCPITFPGLSVIAEGLRAKKSHKQERKFSTLSGLAMHMECGACKGGVAAFRAAIEFVEEELRRLGFGGVRFLMG